MLLLAAILLLPVAACRIYSIIAKRKKQESSIAFLKC